MQEFYIFAKNVVFFPVGLVHLFKLPDPSLIPLFWCFYGLLLK